MTEECKISQFEYENKLLQSNASELSRQYVDKDAQLATVREMGLNFICNNFERLCQNVLNIITKNTVAQNCSIMLMNDDKNRLFLVAAALGNNNYVIDALDILSKKELSYCLRYGEGSAGQAVQEKKTILAQDTDELTICTSDTKTKGKFGSTLSIPLIVEDATIGVLNLNHTDKNAFENKDISLFNIIANFTALLIHNTLNCERLPHEEKISRAKKELKSQVEDKTVELRNINKQLLFEIQERKKAEEQIKASLLEKEVLLREIHHRVKNNLQIISSMLYLQADNIKDLKFVETFKVSQSRIASIALIHEKLYQSKNTVRIDYNEYLTELSDYLFRSYGVYQNKVALKMDVGSVSLGIDTAVHCGLIVNELISNSIKHAFQECIPSDAPDKPKNEIKISLHSIDANMFELMIGDNGIGLPPDLDFRKTESLGLQLVTMLVEGQLRGKIELDRSDRGTKYKIRFKEKK